jgi:4-carboxymuconolactone decarboxylase
MRSILLTSIFTLTFSLGGLCMSVHADAQNKEKPQASGAIASSALDDMKAVSPEFAKLTEEMLFGDIWKRPPLSARDKSLVTVTVLLSLNRIEQMESHFNRALDNGVTKDELTGAITHVAFYAGWPTAASGLVHLKKVLDEREAKVKIRK